MEARATRRVVVRNFADDWHRCEKPQTEIGSKSCCVPALMKDDRYACCRRPRRDAIAALSRVPRASLADLKL
jgi:hypothetical protein